MYTAEEKKQDEACIMESPDTNKPVEAASSPEESRQARIEQDKEAKKALILQIIASRCITSSKEIPQLQRMGEALQAGDELACSIVSGGLTNFSYKVFLKKNPQTRLYAKLAFSRALWNPNPDHTFALQRTDNEYKMMTKFAKLMMDDDEVEDSHKNMNRLANGQRPTAVATPYFIVDLHEADAKLFVTEWASCDEQFANQYIDGHVDVRVVHQVAKALAKLNSQIVEPDWNNHVRESLGRLRPTSTGLLKNLMSQVNATTDSSLSFNMALYLAQHYGHERMERMLDSQHQEQMETREVLVHNDFHLFNILVEAKPNVSELRDFGETGDFAICDWEMTVSSASGRDAGAFQSMPIAYAMAHAVQGHRNVALHILECNMAFWDTYADSLKKNRGSDITDAYLLKAFRQSLGTMGLYLFVIIYMFGAFKNTLPLDGVADADKTQALEAIGYVGLRFFAMSYDDAALQEALGDESMDLEALRSFYQKEISSQIENLVSRAAAHRRPSRRLRSSMLRHEGRRISDSFLVADAEALRRLSMED
mmetsp:Transcript_6470/g.13497  ORF Transcript_6470/g.13497 Transcript_6470/m.13497 type:complete len:538 (-) Transcript_6470:1535-3148(-)|eukprot:CAMPEP_0172441618 /NCGR_PEP_ID=MMETSP1065-20121228/2139_1 /TAXON_ID=265537 /ORGANISM="Amphiprora paludosa, Strain CCMP125" /LENGTH=537 /DNA_ID=CAMNT_0013191073 /DNA_START=148 /DNA_END=1761 /DNA_ORIENTATION=-